jgi:putative intracellular protease/amidase
MQTKKAYLYVFDTMSDWEYGYLVAELNTGRYFKRNAAPMKIVTVGVTEQMITTMGGLKIRPDISLEEWMVEREQLIILPGGNTWGEAVHQPILEKSGEALKLGAIVAAICGATIGLANNRYLDSRMHTSNNLEYMKMVCPHYKGEKYYVKAPAVADGNVITASGTAPIEFAKEVLAVLEVFTPATLQAWYNLNTTHKAEYYFHLMDSLNR